MRDVLTCPWCGGKRKLIALITDGKVIRAILEHLGLPTAAPVLVTSWTALQSMPTPRFVCGFLVASYLVGRLVGGWGVLAGLVAGVLAARYGDEFWYALGRLFPWRR